MQFFLIRVIYFDSDKISISDDSWGLTISEIQTEGLRKYFIIIDKWFDPKNHARRIQFVKVVTFASEICI